MLDPSQVRVLDLVSPSGTMAVSVAVAPPSIRTCGPNIAAVLQPPVSATRDKVFFRFGNTTIKYLTPDGTVGDATTVPGSPSKVSFFSVSPDDKRIAVVVEDFSGATTISLTLYVEDLKGGRNHKVIYTKRIAKSTASNTLWPMGWHEGSLVLAVVPACAVEPASVVPIEWHVSSAATGVRAATIGIHHCTPSSWPSAAGVVCIDDSVDAGGFGVAYLFNWAGKVVTSAASQNGVDFYSGLSPSGISYFITSKLGAAPPAPLTKIANLGVGQGTVVFGHSACTWIDEDHLLAPDAVITVQKATKTVTSAPTPTPTVVSPTATPRQETVLTTSVVPLPARARAECAGRFPGGL